MASVAELRRSRPPCSPASTSYAGGRFDVRRFRPNLVLDTGAAEGFAEHAWVDRELAVGQEVRPRVTTGCRRCVVTTLAHSVLPHDSGILRTAARHNRPLVRVCTEVVRPGSVRRGDRVAVLP